MVFVSPGMKGTVWVPTWKRPGVAEEVKVSA
jgi:general stress protein 26